MVLHLSQKEGEVEEEEGNPREEGEAEEEEGDPGVGARGQGLFGFVVEGRGNRGGRRRSRGGGEG